MMGILSCVHPYYYSNAEGALGSAPTEECPDYSEASGTTKGGVARYTVIWL